MMKRAARPPPIPMPTLAPVLSPEDGTGVFVGVGVEDVVVLKVLVMRLDVEVGGGVEVVWVEVVESVDEVDVGFDEVDFVELEVDLVLVVSFVDVVFWVEVALVADVLVEVAISSAMVNECCDE
jgi:hypothetical protein